MASRRLVPPRSSPCAASFPFADLLSSDPECLPIAGCHGPADCVASSSLASRPSSPSSSSNVPPPAWLRRVVVLGAVGTTLVPLFFALMLDWVADGKFFEVVAQIIPVLFLALALETKAFNVMPDRDPLTQGQVIWTAAVAITMLVGEGISLATVASGWKSSVPLAVDIFVLGVGLWTLVTDAFVGNPASQVDR